MNVSMASPYWSYIPGDEVILTDEIAEAWEEAKICTILGEAKEDAKLTELDGAPPVQEEDKETKSEDPQSEELVIEEDGEEDPQIKHLGGGYWVLPNGEKVKGKDAALEALKALEAGDNNGTEDDNTTDNGTVNTDGAEAGA